MKEKWLVKNWTTEKPNNNNNFGENQKHEWTI